MHFSRARALAAMLLLGASAAQAEDAAERLGPRTVAPPASRWVSLQKPAFDPQNPPSPEALIRDPKALVAFIDQNPGRLDASQMNAELVLTLTRLLVDADRVFDAERLLAQARAQFPDDWELTRAWARVVLGIGRSNAVSEALERDLVRHPREPTLHYLLGNAWLQTRPRTEISLRQAFTAYARVLALAPDYRDPDGITAPQLRSALSRMGTELGLTPDEVAAASSPGAPAAPTESPTSTVPPSGAPVAAPSAAPSAGR
jgi:hypothetical protein